MSTVEIANPIAGPTIAVARTGAFLPTIVVPMYNEEKSADPFFDALLPVLDACGGEPEVLCIDGITAFSTWPLRVWSYTGLAIVALSLIYASSIIVSTLIYGIDVPGFASLIVLILFLGSIQLISLGVLGEFVGRILIEVKRRPLYLIREIWSAGGEPEQPTEIDESPIS